jgi:hypothetical protein
MPTSSYPAIDDEWPRRSPSDDDLVGWRNGMRLYEQGPAPMQVVNVAEYLSREVGHDLYTQCRLPDDQIVESLRRMLEMLARTPEEPDFWLDAAQGLVRLCFAVIRRRGWQPRELHGDGTLDFKAVAENRRVFEGAIEGGLPAAFPQGWEYVRK